MAIGRAVTSVVTKPSISLLHGGDCVYTDGHDPGGGPKRREFEREGEGAGGDQPDSAGGAGGWGGYRAGGCDQRWGRADPVSWGVPWVPVEHDDTANGDREESARSGAGSDGGYYGSMIMSEEM